VENGKVPEKAWLFGERAMKRSGYDKKLDEVIHRAISRERPAFDFNKWKTEHQKEIEKCRSQTGRVPHSTWRIIMRSRITKLAAAAVVIIAVLLSIDFWDRSIPLAYGLEQTIEANHSVRYLHIRNFRAGEDEPKKLWLEFDKYGQVKNVRMHMPAWDSPSDGAKVAVWKENIAQVWLKDKNALATIGDKTAAANVLKLVEKCDPKLAVENLCQREARGEVKIEIDEPRDKAEPITVTATYLQGSSTPGRREVLFVDQATKLVTAIEFYESKDAEYQYLGLMEFYDYNQPIEAKMFVLDEVPVDALKLDQITQEIGLAQGEFTDNEIAIEVVRQFFEALIAKDYAEAGRLYQGIPAEKMRAVYGEAGSFIRIVSIGEASPDPEFGALRVPCVIEIEKDGEISEWRPHPHGILVCPVCNHPGRWTICGGI
jgi:hypothetical protein